VYQFDNGLHRNTAPFGDAAPALNAMMHCDVFDLAQLFDLRKGKLNGIIYQTPDF
jgi:hypothetical protein